MHIPDVLVALERPSDVSGDCEAGRDQGLEDAMGHKCAPKGRALIDEVEGNCFQPSLVRVPR